MRSTKSRSRGKPSRNNNRSVGNIVNRVFDSSGPEGKVRGTPQQIIEKYNQLARDAHLSNDRVAAENFQQHAEHYMRLLGEAQRENDARREMQEREIREKQAERDRMRTTEGAPQMNDDPAQAPQPDVFDVSDGDSGLVETPETAEMPAAKEAASRTADKPEAKTSRSRATSKSGTATRSRSKAAPRPAAADASAVPVIADEAQASD